MYLNRNHDLNNSLSHLFIWETELSNLLFWFSDSHDGRYCPGLKLGAGDKNAYLFCLFVLKKSNFIDAVPCSSTSPVQSCAKEMSSSAGSDEIHFAACIPTDSGVQMYWWLSPLKGCSTGFVATLHTCSQQYAYFVLGVGMVSLQNGLLLLSLPATTPTTALVVDAQLYVVFLVSGWCEMTVA